MSYVDIRRRPDNRYIDKYILILPVSHFMHWYTIKCPIRHYAITFDALLKMLLAPGM